MHKKAQIVLDIDRTLVSGIELTWIKEIQEKNPNSTACFDKFDKEDHSFELFNDKYFILPGTFELLSWFDNSPQLDFHFFSAGHDKRNPNLVNILLTKALGMFRTAQIIESIIVRSASHLVPISVEEAESQVKRFGFAHSNNLKKKDLTVINPLIDLEWSALVDDFQSYSSPGQEFNLILVQGVDIPDLQHCYECFHGISEMDYNHHNFFKVNQAFFIAGMVSECITRVVKWEYLNPQVDNKSKRYTFLSALDDVKNDILKLNSMTKNESNPLNKHSGLFKYYKIGLNVLKEINPLIEFFGPDYFFNTLEPCTKKFRYN